MNVQRVLIALVAIGAVGALVVAGLTQQDTRNASISVSSQRVEPGDTVEVAGTCTQESDRDTVPIVLRGSLEGGQLGEVGLDDNGNFSGTVEVPEMSSTGAGVVTARCGIGGEPSTSLTVVAAEPAETSLSVTPQTVEPGESIDVAGTCTADSDRDEVPITLGGDLEGGRLATIDAGADGDFSDTIQIPEGAFTGSGELTAECGLGSDVDPRAPLTISAPTFSPVPSPVPSPTPVPTPTISVNPSTVEAGNSIDVTGTCTGRTDRQETVIILGGGIEGGQLGRTDLDSDGDFAASVAIPVDSPTGEGTLFATCGLGADETPTTTLTITEPAREPSIEANPSTVETGGTFDVIGTCTTRSDEEQVGILLGGGIEGGSLGVVHPDENGDFATTIEIPADSPTGEGTLFAGCGLGADETPTTTLTITEPAREPSIEANPSTVEAGENFEVTGTCTERSDEDEAPIILGGDIEGGQLGTTELDDNGDFATTIEIPADSPTGEGTLFAGCGLGSDETPTTTLTIEAPPEPTISVDPQTVEAGGTIEVTGTCTTRSDEDEVPIILGGDIEGGQLGTTDLDDNGDFASTIEIPADSPTGEGTLFADCGLDDDNPTTALTIEESENSDGDGIGNGLDPIDDIDDLLEPIQQGDAGGLVTLWQLQMNEWLALSETDFGPLEVDGQFGDQTQEATRIFQEANGEVPTDLIVHQEDREALEESIERLKQEQSTVSLSRGDTSHAVSVWQEALNEALLMSTPDYRPLAVDGIFGPETEQATREFQESNQEIETDLVVDAADRNAIRLAIERFDGTDSSPLQRGDRGGLVAIWQSRLNTWLTLAQIDHGPVAIDGVFGSDTEEATRRFQETSDKVETDLLVHGDDWTELRESTERLMGGS